MIKLVIGVTAVDDLSDSNRLHVQSEFANTMYLVSIRYLAILVFPSLKKAPTSLREELFKNE